MRGEARSGEGGGCVGASVEVGDKGEQGSLDVKVSTWAMIFW